MRPPSSPIKPGMTNSPEKLNPETRPLVATTIVARLNARVAVRLLVKRATLRALPARRSVEYEELPARVSQYAVLTVRGALTARRASSPSQLVGQRLTVRLGTDPIACELGGTRGLERARLTHRDGQRHRRDIDTPIDPFQAAWRTRARGRAASGLIETAQCIQHHQGRPLVRPDPQRLSAVLIGC